MLLQKDKMQILIIFLAGFFFLAGISYFPKRMLVYPDELRYLQLTDGLFNHGDLLIRCAHDNFTKVMYPIMLFPAAAFSGTEYYTRAISLMNSFYMAFVPVLSMCLAKICHLDTKKTIILILLSFSYPDLLYVMTFMSENLYIPLGIGTIFMVWKSLDLGEDNKRFYAISVLLGVLFYLIYLNKEIGAALPLSYLLLGIYIHVCGDGRRLPWRGILLSLGLFFILLVGVKNIFFSGISNSYAQQVFFSKASLLESVIYFFEVCLIHFDRTVFAFFVFPVVIPLVYWQALDKTVRYRYVFITLCLVISLAVVSYTVTLYEDYPSLAPREHMRYVSFLYLPYLALSMQALELGREKLKYFWLALLVFLFLGTQLLLTASFNAGAHVDQIMLKYVLNHPQTHFAVIAVLALVSWLFYRHKKHAVILLAILMLSASLANQAKIYKDFRAAYEVNKETVKIYDNMFLDLKDIENDILCIVSPNIFDGTSLFDCYPNRMPIVSYRLYHDVWDVLPEYKYDARVALFHDIKQSFYIYYPNIVDYTERESVNYLLVSTDAEANIDHNRTVFIKQYETGFTLYENLEPTVVPFIRK